MELRQLQYLVDVIDEASFTKAAAKAHVAQPGVSAQIRSLERELGQTLLDRSGRTVRPTEAGTAIAAYARSVLATMSDLRQAADALRGPVSGRLGLGMVGSISTPRIDLPGLLVSFHDAYPGVEITLIESTSDQLLAALHDRRFDIAFIGLGPQPPGGAIQTRILATEPIVVVVNDDHPLARHKNVTLRSLQRHTLISLPEGSGIRARINAACVTAGVQLRIAFEANHPHLLADFAARGLGAAILPASAAQAYSPGLRVLPLVRPRIEGHIALAWRTGHPTNRTTQAFLDHTARRLNVPQ